MYEVECTFDDLKNMINYLHLEGINVQPFCISVIDQSVFLHGKRVYFPQNIDGCNFDIFTQQPYVFERLMILFTPKNESVFPVYTSDDFKQSCCKMIILIYDSANIEILVKDIDAGRILYQNALKNNAKLFVLHENEDDMRQEFYI